MNAEDTKELVSHLKDDDLLTELMTAAEPESTLTEDGAALGLNYPLGNGWIAPPPAGVFCALALIDSPLLGRVEDTADSDVYRALYAVGGGKDALTPIMSLVGRLDNAKRYEATAEKKPETFAVYLKHVDNIAQVAWREFDASAVTFAEQFGNVKPVEIFAVLTRILMDAQAGLQMVGGGGGGSESKKKVLAPSGWRRFRRMARNTLLWHLNPWRGKCPA